MPDADQALPLPQKTLIMTSKDQSTVYQPTLQHTRYKHLFNIQFTGHSFGRPRPLNSRQTKSGLENPLIRILLIFSLVIVFSLLAAWTGCLIACLHGKRKRTRRNAIETAIDARSSQSTDTRITSSADHSSEYDVEIVAQLNTIMANETFKGREWNAYKREMRMKAKRQARGVVRTSQGIPMPINVSQLKGKMKEFSRSLLRSMTRSDVVQDQMPDFVALDEVIERSRNTATASKSPDLLESKGQNETTESVSRAARTS